jgi:hypothetical protein
MIRNPKKRSGAFETYESLDRDLYPLLARLTGSQRKVVLSENFRKTADASNNNKVMVAPVITSFSPTTTTAGTKSVLTINGVNFGATRGSGFVEFRRGAGGASYFCAGH